MSIPISTPAEMPLSSSSTPEYTLQKGRNTTTMRIGDWTISSTKKPILNGKEIEVAEKRLCFPLPEMTFGNNLLRLTFSPGSSSSSTTPLSPIASTSDPSSAIHPAGSSSEPVNLQESEGEHQLGDRVEIRFDALDNLSGVAVGEGWEERVGGGVLVSMAEHWGKNRPKNSAFAQELPSKPVRPHDWTYSSISPGTTLGGSFEASTSHSIPMQLLSRQDPILDRILFYEDVPLFEDELHDNGESILNVRIRVMPHSFFILSRHFLRVDNVLFRMFDVRIYHAFGSGEVIREVTGMEATYEEVKSKLESTNDLSPLTNPNFVYQAMQSLLSPSSYPQREDGETGRLIMREGKGKPWPGLGSRVEVLKLGGGVDGAVEGFGRLGVD